LCLYYWKLTGKFNKRGENQAVEALIKMAELAAKNRIRGRSFKRNSILKPLDIILENLEQEPKDDIRAVTRAASSRDIFDHLDRIAGADYTFGRGKQAQIEEYTDLFFDGILRDFHKNDVNRLLQRSKKLQSAYLLFFYHALPEREKVEAEKEQAEEVSQLSLNLAE
jgi:CRISPR-associated protein Csc3